MFRFPVLRHGLHGLPRRHNDSHSSPITMLPLEITNCNCMVLQLPIVTALFKLTFSTTLTHCLPLFSYYILQLSYWTLNIFNFLSVIVASSFLIAWSSSVRLRLQELPKLTQFAFTELLTLSNCWFWIAWFTISRVLFLNCKLVPATYLNCPSLILFCPLQLTVRKLPLILRAVCHILC